MNDENSVSDGMIEVTYVNNTGEGFSRRVEVQEGTTIELFVAARTGEVNFDAYTIRVNRDAVERNYTLEDGDRITVVPTSIKGA